MRISKAVKAMSVIGLMGLASVGQVGRSEAAYCRGGDTLGVSRTVNLNTNGGARFGSSHGGHRNFLREGEVVLTFDDGPIPSTTNKVLLELERHCTKATFFMVGQMAKNNPRMVRKVLSKGHTVGIHSYSHRNLGQTNAKTAVMDVDRSINAINKAAGRKVAAFFRFPYLSENGAVNSYLNKRNYGVFAIDVDSLDYKFSNSSSMVNRVMSELRRKGKGIILMHDIKKVTARGIAELLTRLNKEGYKVVHIKGRGGKSVADPFVVADNDTRQSRSWTLKPSISVQIDRSGDLSTAFKRPRMVRKRPKEKEMKVAALSKNSKLKSRQLTFRQKVNLRKKAFRDKLKLRLTIQ